MTAIEKKGFYSSLIFTSIFSLLMILGCIFIKAKEKPVYKTLQISLAKPLPAETKIEKSAQNISEKVIKEEQAVEKPVEKKIEKPAEKPVEKTEAKAVQKTETKPAVKEVSTPKKTEAAKPKSNEKVVNAPVIKKSVEELAKEQNVVQKKVEWDDSLFDDDFDFETKETASSNNVKTAQKSSLEGVAAVSETSSSSVKTSSSSNSNSTNTSATKSTLDALSEMENASVYASSESKKTSEAKGQSSASLSSGHLSLEFNGGRTRELISPSVLEINLSKESQRTVSVTTTVRITFVILANGTVPVSDITFMPQGLLTSSVQNEIKNQIHTWNFSSDPSLSSTSASFDFTIVVK